MLFIRFLVNLFTLVNKCLSVASALELLQLFVWIHQVYVTDNISLSICRPFSTTWAQWALTGGERVNPRVAPWLKIRASLLKYVTNISSMTVSRRLRFAFGLKSLKSCKPRLQVNFWETLLLRGADSRHEFEKSHVLLYNPNAILSTITLAAFPIYCMLTVTP